MKKLFFVLLASAAVTFVNAQTPGTEPAPGKTEKPIEAITIDKLVHDFGKIPQGTPVYTDFVVKNNADKELIISDVQASCGCTTPEWNREAVATGESTKIKVGYNAATLGEFEKTITITYNDGQRKVIRIKGEVFVQESVAKNAAGAQLKKDIF